MRVIGLLFFVGGLIALCFFAFVFDTTVQGTATEIMGQSFGGGRTHNLGLQNDRICGMILGAALLISGSVMASVPTAKEIRGEKA